MTNNCTLSAQGEALSASLTAFVGSIVTGITNGGWVALVVLFCSYVAAFRITIISALGLSVTIFGPDCDSQNPFVAQKEVVATGSNANSSSNKNNLSNVTILGAAGWIYAFVYTPPSQIVWLAANWSSTSAQLKFIRAMGVGVIALAYTFDTRARYGMALGRKFGSERVVPRLMNVFSAAMNMLLSVIVVVLLIGAASGVGKDTLKWVVPLYVFTTITYGLISLRWCRPRDASYEDDGFWPDGYIGKLCRVLAGLFVGAFLGFAVAMPSFLFWAVPDDKNQGMGLQRWLGCESVSWWEKVVKVLP